MRIYEIVGVAADAHVGEAVATGVGRSLPDDWQRRADATRRDQEPRRKLAQKVRDTEARKNQQQRAAQDRQPYPDDRSGDLKRHMAAEPAAS